MPWFVLLAVAIICSALSTVVSCVLVARYALFERIATVILRRGLRGISDKAPANGGASYTVTRTESGERSYRTQVDAHIWLFPCVQIKSRQELYRVTVHTSVLCSLHSAVATRCLHLSPYPCSLKCTLLSAACLTGLHWNVQLTALIYGRRPCGAPVNCCSCP